MRTSIDAGVLEITIDRPERKGSLRPVDVLAMIGALEDASTDDSLRAIVVRSAGDDFCAGADWV